MDEQIHNQSTQTETNPRKPITMAYKDTYCSFIVRLRYGGVRAGKTEPGWRSEVDHIQSGGHWDFTTLAELEQFLHNFLRQQEQSLSD